MIKTCELGSFLDGDYSVQGLDPKGMNEWACIQVALTRKQALRIISSKRKKYPGLRYRIIERVGCSTCTPCKACKAYGLL